MSRVRLGVVGSKKNENSGVSKKGGGVKWTVCPKRRNIKWTVRYFPEKNN